MTARPEQEWRKAPAEAFQPAPSTDRQPNSALTCSFACVSDEGSA
jgi:hypothetical protein